MGRYLSNLICSFRSVSATPSCSSACHAFVCSLMPAPAERSCSPRSSTTAGMPTCGMCPNNLARSHTQFAHDNLKAQFSVKAKVANLRKK